MENMEQKLELLGNLIIKGWVVEVHQGEWEFHEPKQDQWRSESLLIRKPTFAEVVDELLSEKVKRNLKAWNLEPNGERKPQLLLQPKGKTQDEVFS
jgi:hypothetical protein